MVQISDTSKRFPVRKRWQCNAWSLMKFCKSQNRKWVLRIKASCLQDRETLSNYWIHQAQEKLGLDISQRWVKTDLHYFSARIETVCAVSCRVISVYTTFSLNRAKKFVSSRASSVREERECNKTKRHRWQLCIQNTWIATGSPGFQVVTDHVNADQKLNADWHGKRSYEVYWQSVLKI